MIKIHNIGGCSEVGKNCILVQVDEEAVILDMGLHMQNYISLTQDEDIEKISTKQLIKHKAIPDIDEIKKLNLNIKGICISHAHYDHIGAIPFLEKNLDTYIHGTAYTIEILNEITKKAGKKLKNNVKVHKENERFKISKKIEIEFIRVTHSIPQAVIIVVHTKEKKIMYVNDYKLDDNPAIGKKTNKKRLNNLKDKIDLLIINTLYADKEGRTDSEQVAENKIKDILTKENLENKKVIITTFASNIGRIKSIITLAKQLNKKIAILGGSMGTFLNAAKNTGLIRLDKEIILGAYGNFVQRFLKRTTHEEYIYIVTGGQGEQKAVLTKIANKELDIGLNKDDIIIFSCNTIPVEPNKTNRLELEKKLKKQKVTLYKNAHASGHGAQEEYKEMILTLNPKHIIPSHSTKRQIKAAKEIANKLGYKDNFHILKAKDTFELD